MKIFICNVQEFDPKIGGIERVSISVAQELNKLGVEVIFVACRRSRFSQEYELPGKSYFLPTPDDYSTENTAYLIDLINREKPSAIINQNAHSFQYHKTISQACKQTGTPLLSVLHFSPDMRIKGNQHTTNWEMMPLLFNLKSCLRTVCTYPPLRFITNFHIRKLYRALYSDSSKVVLLSDRYIPVFEKIAGIKTDPNKILGIPNMLSFPTEDCIPTKKKQILWCGRLDFSHKRPDRILEIWNKIQHKLLDWELIIVGDGPLAPQCKQYAQKLRLERIRFEGLQNPIPYYKDASIFTLTSNNEGWPLVLNEAMQYGCVPVAYGNFEPIYDIITDDSYGHVIKPFKEQDFIECLLKLTNDPNLPQKAAIAQQRTKRFLPETIGRQWLSILQAITHLHSIYQSDERLPAI